QQHCEKNRGLTLCRHGDRSEGGGRYPGKGTGMIQEKREKDVRYHIQEVASYKVTDSGGAVMVDRRAAGQPLFLAADFPEDMVSLLAFDPRGTRLGVSCKDADHALIFDLRRGREVARLTDLPDMQWLALLSAHVVLAVCRRGCVRCDLRRDSRETICEEP